MTQFARRFVYSSDCIEITLLIWLSKKTTTIYGFVQIKWCNYNSLMCSLHFLYVKCNMTCTMKHVHSIKLCGIPIQVVFWTDQFRNRECALWKIQNNSVHPGMCTCVSCFVVFSFWFGTDLSNHIRHGYCTDTGALRLPQCQCNDPENMGKYLQGIPPGVHFNNMVWFAFDPNMDKQAHAQYSERWNYLSIPKLQRLYRWRLGMNM